MKAAKTGGFFAVGVGAQDQLSEADVVVDNLEGVTVSQLRTWMEHGAV